MIGRKVAVAGNINLEKGWIKASVLKIGMMRWVILSALQLNTYSTTVLNNSLAPTRPQLALTVSRCLSGKGDNTSYQRTAATIRGPDHPF